MITTQWLVAPGRTSPHHSRYNYKLRTSKHVQSSNLKSSAEGPVNFGVPGLIGQIRINDSMMECGTCHLLKI